MNFSVPNAPMVEPARVNIIVRKKSPHQERAKSKQDEMEVDGISASLIFIFRFVSGSDEVIR